LGGGSVGGFDAEASDSSSELSFSSSPCAGFIISRTQSGILVCGVLFEQYETVLGSHV
jgi:hypothetical protein